jgi:deazaflavin-dependent oxidoreductase (nitroreductase family)
VGVEVPGKDAAHHLDLREDERGAMRKTSRKRIVRVVIWVLAPYAVLLALFALFSVTLRFGGPQVRSAVRAFNKRFLNPAMMRLAGSRHWYAAVIRHRGRRSGKGYATPVVAVPVEGGFVIPLPYGEEVDWLKNVLAAGRATVEAKGETDIVVEPQVITAQAAFPLLDERHRRTWRLFGIDRYLELRRLPETVTADGRRPDRFAKNGKRWELRPAR